MKKDILTTQQIVDVLSACSFFVKLPHAKLKKLASICKVVVVDQEFTLFKEDEDSQDLFVVVKGEVLTYLLSGDGAKEAIAKFGPNSAFGELAVFDMGLRSAAAVTLMPSILLKIEPKLFHDFLYTDSRVLQQILLTLSGYIRTSNARFAEIATALPSEETLPDSEDITLVTLAGYGIYGRKLLGPKYTNKSLGCHVDAIIDPTVTLEDFHNSPLAKARPTLRLFRSIDEWYDVYFSRLSKASQERVAVEVNLKPKFTCSEVLKYIEHGVKNLIIAKPVTHSQEEFKILESAVKKHRVKAAIGSQWYYTDLSKFLRYQIAQIATLLRKKNFFKVVIDFSKEHSLDRGAYPVLRELPHALQIAHTFGFIDFAIEIAPVVTGDETQVELYYANTTLSENLYLRSNLDVTPPVSVKARYPNWEVQIRTVEIYLTSHSVKPEVCIDVWLKFDRFGRLTLNHGYLKCDVQISHGHPLEFKIDFTDDLLMTMTKKIHAALRQCIKTAL
jgi:CRP-like cAMP-binding protein